MGIPQSISRFLTGKEEDEQQLHNNEDKDTCHIKQMVDVRPRFDYESLARTSTCAMERWSNEDESSCDIKQMVDVRPRFDYESLARTSTCAMERWSNEDESSCDIKQMVDVRPRFDYESLARTSTCAMERWSNEDESSCDIKQMVDVRPRFDYESLARTSTCAMERWSNEDESSCHIKQMVDVRPRFDYESLARTSTCAMERWSNEDESSCHIKQMVDVRPRFDYESLARTSTCAMERWSNEDESSCHIKWMDVIIDVPNLVYQSLAHTNTFDAVDSAVFSIKNEENEVEEVEEEKVTNFWVRGGKWITHYNSYHWVLLVGEGDFSFSASLAVAFGYAPNMIATSLDSVEFLKKNYRCAMSNIEKLRRRGCTVMHGIDATKIATELFEGMMFDRIIYNFPFAGFFKDLSREAQIRKHRRLLSLFLKNAKELIGENGEIHISHKTTAFQREWKLELLASSHGLRLIEAVDFNKSDYKGYNTKYGFGGDKNFNCRPSKTSKFGLKRSTSWAY